MELSNPGNAQDVQEFSKLLVRYKDTLTPIAFKRGDVLRDFLPECLKHIVSEPLAESFFTPQFVLNNWTVFSSKINEWKKDVPRFEGTLAEIANNPELTDEIQRTGFKAEQSDLYRLVIKNGKSNASAFRSWLRTNLERLTSAEWESAMLGRGQLVDLASALKNSGTVLNLGEQYQNAILSTVEHILNNTAQDGFVILSDMAFLLSPLDETDRHSVYNRVYEMAQLANGEFPPGFFSAFGKFISPVLRLDQQSVSSIFKPIVESRGETDLKWLLRLFRENPSLLKDQPDPHAVNELKKTVLTAGCREPADFSTPLIDQLAHAIGIGERKENADEHG